MNVECNFFGPFRDTIGTKTIKREYSGEITLIELIRDLETDYGGIEEQLLSEDGTLNGTLSITVDGEHVRQLDSGATELSDGSVVRFSPPVSGGDGA